MTKIKTMKCNYCGQEYHISDSTYDNGQFIHAACYLEYENNDLEPLEDTIIKRFLEKEGYFHKYYGGYQALMDKHFDKNSEHTCHWIKIYDLNKDDTIREFTSTFNSDQLTQVISAKADCACGKYNGTQIYTEVTIPELINFAIDNGLVNDI